MIDNKSNTYVIIPPEKGSSLFLVKNKTQFEKDNLVLSQYRDSFDLILLNGENLLSESEHEGFLKEILPSLALVLQVNFENETKDLMDAFLFALGKDSDSAKKIGQFDYTSSLILIISAQIEQYFALQKEKGHDFAKLNFSGFLSLIGKAYMQLPYLLIDSILNRYAKNLIKKSKITKKVLKKK